MMMRCLLSIASVFILGISARVSAEDPAPERFSLRIYDTLHLGKTFDVYNAKPGGKMQATVILENELQTSFVLQKVELGCKCTKANIPQIELGPGEVATCEFEFDLPDVPRRESETYSATIQCGGAIKVVRMNFKFPWKHLVALPQTDLTVTYLPTEKFKEFEIPLVFTEGASVKKTLVSLSEELRPLSTRIDEKSGRVYITAGFSPSELGTSPTTGEVTLVSESGNYRSNMLLTLRSIEPISVVPSQVTFYPTKEDEFVLRGLAILKIRNTQGSLNPSVRDVTCTTSTGHQLSVRFNPLTEGNFRLEALCKNYEELTPKSELVWSILLSDGTKASIKSGQSFTHTQR